MISKKNWNIVIVFKKFIYILLTVMVISGGIVLCVYDSISAHLYGKDNPEAKGKVLTTYLSIIGGACVIYGLYLNNKKISEQIRQNNIADKSNNDKRFGDAISCLNNNNTGISIGGVYILNQLAKEDKRYIPIVANVFLEILSQTGEPDLKDRKTKLIFESIFSDTFSSQKINFNSLTIKKTLIKNINNKYFENCCFEDVYVSEIFNSTFTKCCLTNIRFLSVSRFTIMLSKIWRCGFSNHSTGLTELVIDNCTIANSDIDSIKSINMLKIIECKIQGDLHITSPIIIYTKIDVDSNMEKNILIATNNLDGISLKNKGNVTVIEYNDQIKYAKRDIVDKK